MDLKSKSRLVFIGITILSMLFLTEVIYAAQKSPSGTKNPAPEAAPPTSQPISQDEKVLTSFRHVVDEFASFFKTNPKFVAKNNVMSSMGPKGMEKSTVYFIEQYMFQEIAFDVRKTDSLVSPYTGFVDLVVDEKSNKGCGDAKFRTYNLDGSPMRDPRTTYFIGFSNIEDALAKGDDPACLETIRQQRRHRFEFAYQSDRWVLKNIRFFKDKDKELLTNDFLAAVFEMQEGKFFLFLTEPNGLRYNQKLFNFIKPYRE